MNAAQGTNRNQAELWNGAAGRAWVDAQAVLDRMFAPVEDLLAGAVAAAAPRSVLDVGCGTGSSTVAVSRLLGAAGQCLGIDISAPMIGAARARAERERSSAMFITANAEHHSFEPASVDMIISRFGVMFFDDPIQAFSNLRRAAANDATLQLVVWRSAVENPFMTTAERAAAPLLPELPARQPDGPGQFAFADRNRVRAILQESGWAQVEISPVDVECAFAERDLDLYLTRLGPVGMFLEQQDEATRAQVVATVRAAFAPYVHDANVRFTAACWTVAARAAAATPQSPA